MQLTFMEWLTKSPYHWYARSNLSVSDRKTVDMMRDAFKAGTKSDELDRAAELLREEDAIAAAEKRLAKEYPAGSCNAEDAWSDHDKRVREFKERRDAFLREIEG